MVTQVVPKWSTSGDFPFQKIIQKKSLLKNLKTFFHFFLFLAVLKKKSPRCKHLEKHDTASDFGFTHSLQGLAARALSKTCHCCNGFPQRASSLNALIPIFCFELQQEPLISFATKDFYGLFSFFPRLALQNFSVLREVPIPPYSQDTREGGSSCHVLSTCLDGLAPWTST
jgi:hypothetical protein